MLFDDISYFLDARRIDIIKINALLIAKTLICDSGAKHSFAITGRIKFIFMNSGRQWVQVIFMNYV